uniref:Uncharacterized protein n=1 Tax=viral metagenome TaxID=1070528 RepID=A0A6M3Y4E9_9ZZZZ
MDKETSGTGPQMVHETEPTPQPVQVAPAKIVGPRQVERQGGLSVPYVGKLPTVRGGVCDCCGTLDGRFPPEQQYKLCEHYRGIQLRCSYCDETKVPDDVIGHAVMNIYEHPTDRDAEGKPTLVVVCNSFNCTSAHEKRFTR